MQDVAPVLTLRHVKESIENNFEWAAQKTTGGTLHVEHVVHEVKTPAKTHKVGWSVVVGVDAAGIWSESKMVGWNRPSLTPGKGEDTWPLEEIPKKFKKRGFENACRKGIGELRAVVSFDVRLPNGLMARWNPLTDVMQTWGEIPKKLRELGLTKKELAWPQFIEEQKRRGGELAVKNWEQKLLLLREPHKTTSKKFDSEETLAYKAARRDAIKKHMDRLKAAQNEAN